MPRSPGGVSRVAHGACPAPPSIPRPLAIGHQVQRAYLRTNLLEQRHELAELWAEFLSPQSEFQ